MLGSVNELSRKGFWSKGRRKALSSTSLTLFQVLLGGAVLGGAFGKFGLIARLALVAAIGAAFVIGILSAPDD